MCTTDSLYSGFLSLPTELRCHIYDYLLTEPYAITISAGYITCFGNRIQDRARKTEIPGLPLDLAPLARRHHDTSLLSVAEPPTIAVDNGRMDDIAGENLGYPAPFALLLTSRLVNDELTDHMRRRRRIAQARSTTDADGVVKDTEENQEGLSLYVSYPYGVLVLKSLYPFLLRQARRVHISGHYTDRRNTEPTLPESPDLSDEDWLTPGHAFVATSFTTPSSGPTSGLNSTFNTQTSSVSSTTQQGVSVRSQRPRLRLDAPLPRQARQASQTATIYPPFSKSTTTSALAALAHLVRTLLPPEPTQLVKLSTNILFPGENTYGLVWSDHSPISNILGNICGGKIDMQCYRGSLGCGLRLTALPNPSGRILSTIWKNWKVETAVNQNGRSMTRSLRVGDLDTFLTGEEFSKS